MSTVRRRNILFTVAAVLSIFLDQWTKVLARANLALDSWQGVTVIDGFFNLRLSMNSGVAFGMMQKLPGGRIILSLIGLAALGLVFYYLRQTTLRQIRMHLALGLVAGGAVGNLIDRIAFGKVTDFIVWHYKGHEWPAFNVADAALVVGVCLMAMEMLLEKKGHAAGNAPAESADDRPSRGRG
jgi:signal peptidase II